MTIILSKDWPRCVGIGGRDESESVAAMPRNAHTIVGAGIIITVLGYLVLGIMGVMPGQPDENRPESEQSSE